MTCPQDLVSRFTLDSATEFLFGRDVQSLSAGLPYPPSSDVVVHKLNEPNPADDFAKAFLEAQSLSAGRGRYTSAWAVFEIFEDKVAVPMKTIDAFIQPILKDALEKKAQKSEVPTNGKQVADDETLLGHLVNLTDGEYACCNNVDSPPNSRDRSSNFAGRDTQYPTCWS